MQSEEAVKKVEQKWADVLAIKQKSEQQLRKRKRQLDSRNEEVGDMLDEYKQLISVTASIRTSFEQALHSPLGT